MPAAKWVSMGYLIWAIIALVGYSFVPPLMRLATREIPYSVATFGAASTLALTALSLSLLTQEPITDQLTGSHGQYVLFAGIFLAISILSFFRALSDGPVSIVVPIFGLFLVISSGIGILFLDEQFSLRQLFGIGLAIAAIVVISTE